MQNTSGYEVHRQKLAAKLRNEATSIARRSPHLAVIQEPQSMPTGKKNRQMVERVLINWIDTVEGTDLDGYGRKRYPQHCVHDLLSNENKQCVEALQFRWPDLRLHLRGDSHLRGDRHA